MTYKFLPTNLADLFRQAGLTVVELDGWQKRGRPASTGEFKPVGVLNHHTGAFDGIGDAAQDLQYAKWMALEGRSDLPAPLCQVSLSAEGVLYLSAAGRANHAGKAKSVGSVAAGDGNALYVGIEWMLSGKQPIPAKMYEAGAKANAVLLKVLGSSVRAVACHYQTSTTGKWDIGDPNGVSFNGAKVMDVAKFREVVQDYMVPPKPTSRVVKMIHASLQIHDTKAKITADLEKIFTLAAEQKVQWITGTEAFGPRVSTILEASGGAHGFRVERAAGQDCWIAVRKSFIAGNFDVHWEKIIEGGEAHRDLGVFNVSFDTDRLGRISVFAEHLLTAKQKNAAAKNHKVVMATAARAKLLAAGTDLGFVGADKNKNDKFSDTFLGTPFTSLGDELKKYEPTHPHGKPIDVIGTWNKDGRVNARSLRVLDDTEFKLFGDHFLVIGSVDVEFL